MSLNIFAILTLGIIILVLATYNRKRTAYGAYVLLFIGLFVAAKFTIRSYLYPPQRVFGNHQYHFLEHQGFQYTGNKPVLLASGQTPGKAIYNQYKGGLSIDGSNGKYTLAANKFEAPVYVAAAPGRGIKQLSFTLANAPGSFNAAKGFGLQKGSEKLLCNIEPDGDRSRYIFTYSNDSIGNLKDTSSMRQTINYGLPLMTLLRQTGLPLSEDMEEQCTALLLVRQTVWGNTGADNNSPLLLFPGDNTVLANTRFLDAQGQALPALRPATSSTALAANQLFYIGFAQRAANNTDDPVWFVNDDAKGKQLRLLMPNRFELPGQDSVLEKNKVLFVASGSKQVITHNFGAGYLLPWFNDDSTHRLHTFSYFSFTPGSARDSLIFNITDLQGRGSGNTMTVHGNQPFTLQTEETGVSWLFQFANMHEASHLQASTMEWVIGAYILGVLIILLLIQKHNQQKKLFTPGQSGPTIPRLELVIYIAVLPFLILRLLILWRIAVFPPSQGIDYLQLADYLNKENFYQLIAYGLLPFFVIRLIVLLAQQFRLYTRYFKDAKQTMRQELRQLAGSIRNTLLLTVAAIVVSVLYTAQKLDIKYAGFLLLVYLAAIAISVLTIVPFKKFSLRKSERVPLPARMEKFLQGPVWMLVLKGLLSCLVLFLAGGVAGYVLTKIAGFMGPLQRFVNVFIPVCVFLYLYWRWMPGQHIYHNRFRQHYWLRIMAGAFISGVLLLADSGFSIIFIFFCSIIFLAELFYFYLNLSIGHRKIAWAGAAALLLILLGFSYAITYAYKAGGVREVVNRILGENNNIKYRALVQTSQEDKLAAGLYFKEEAFTKLQNASANKWFINYYLNQPHTHYFQLQPHMDFGVSYPVQTMDLLMLRYVVAEHGEWLVVLLLALLLTISFSAGLGYRFADGVANANQYVAFAAGLLVFVIGFMVWLASTNRFIFFGQDFPLLSIQAKITTLLFFVFLLIVIANNRETILKKGYETAGNLSLHIFLLATVLVFFMLNKKKETGAYNMAYVVQQVQDKAVQLNASFLNFQEELQDRRKLPAGFKNILNEYKKSEDWAIVQKQNEAEKDSLPFVYSVVDRLFQPNTEKYNPGQLMHVVRNNNGLYEFAVNRHYFQVKPPSVEQSDWKGALVGAYSQKNIAVLNDASDLIMQDSLPSVYNLPGQAGASIAYYPPGFAAREGEPLAIYSGGSGGTVLINPAKQAAYAANGVYRLSPSDWLQFAGRGGARSNYFLREGHSQYLARSIWLNGGYRLFYPFEDKFIWPYNMGNAVAQSYAGTGRIHQDFVASLDYDLHNTNAATIASFEDQLMRRNDSIRIKNRRQVVTVAVINGDGYVWDMQELDFNRKAQPAFNPNNSNDHFRFLRQLYTRRNASTERKVLGHQALLNMYNPGSTMKPFVYAATISGSKLDWGSLEFVNYNKSKYVELDEKKLRVKYYTGHKMSHGFEHDITAGVTGPVDYLSQSKNMYHSMIVYLGSYTEKELDTANMNRVMVPAIQPEANFENFPLFNYRGQQRIFNPAYPPRDESGKKYFGNSKAVVADKLWNNFALTTTQEEFAGDSSLRRNIPNTDRNELRLNTSYGQYAFPEKSAFMQYMRRVDVFGDRNGLTNPTVGAVVVQVSPVKMAEMGARLFTANADLRIRMGAADTATYYQPFTPARNYTGLDDLLAMYQQTLYTGMNKAAKGGTATSLVDVAFAESKGYYTYAKTGTADVDDAKLRHKTLLVVLSKEKLHEGALTGDLLRNNKVICFYFSFFNHAGSDWLPADREVIKTVIRNTLNSEAAKRYGKK